MPTRSPKADRPWLAPNGRPEVADRQGHQPLVFPPEKDGGFRCVKAMGFDLAERGLVQVSMNLTNYTVTPIRTVYEAVASQAAAAGVDVEESELVGLAPRAALDESTAKHVRLRGFDARKQIIESLLGLE